MVWIPPDSRRPPREMYFKYPALASLPVGTPVPLLLTTTDFQERLLKDYRPATPALTAVVFQGDVQKGL